MNTYLEFEKPIEQLDNKVHELKSLNDNAPSDNLLEEITQVEEQINETYRKIYSSISPWQRTLVARHPQRPKTREYIQNLIEDFFPLSGDRFFSEDKAILGGAIGAPVAASLGIFDVTNPGELFRPKGYAQSYAEKGSQDRRKTAEPGMEIFERFFLGRRGRPLKYETAKQDIPDLTPQRYAKALRSQYQDRGLLGMGLLKGTTENIEGYPEIRIVGFPVGAQAVGALAGGIAGSRTAGKLGLVSPVASRKSIIKGAAVTLAGSLGGAATGKTLNMAIASANRPKYLTTSDYMQG